MKICYLADGQSVHTQRWCKYFLDLGNEVHLITLKDVAIEGVHVHFVDAGYISTAGGNWRVVFKHMEIKALVKRISPDILHAHYATSYGLLGALTGFHPFFISAMGTDVLISPFQSRVYKAIIKYSLKKADWVTSMADHMTEKLILLGVPKEKTSVVIFGIDDKVFNRLNRKLPDDKFVITTTRGLEPVYNHPLFFKAIKKVKDQMTNLQVNLIGDGSQRQQLEAMVKELGIDDMVTFLGRVPQQTIAETLNQSHLFITVSFSDGNNISLNEAMSCGTFAIASDIPANRQWIKDSINGFLVPIDNADILAEKITFVYKNFKKLETACFAYNDKIISKKALWRKNMKIVKEKYDSFIS